MMNTFGFSDNPLDGTKIVGNTVSTNKKNNRVNLEMHPDRLREIVKIVSDAPRWLPFETAPKGHGELIVVWRKDSSVFAAQWILDVEDPDENGHWFDHTGEDLTGDLPTLWQPLPREPEIQE